MFLDHGCADEASVRLSVMIGKMTGVHNRICEVPSRLGTWKCQQFQSSQLARYPSLKTR